MSNPNQDICDMLIKLGEHERDVNGIIYKYHAYRKAAKALETYGKRVSSGAEAQKLSGIGPKIAQKIQDFLQNDETSLPSNDTPADDSKTPTKESKKNKKDKSSVSKKSDDKKKEIKATDNYLIADYYDKFYQMTKIDALNLAYNGIKRVIDLKNQSDLLNKAQQLCLENFDDLCESIPGEEMEKFEKQLKKLLTQLHPKTQLFVQLTGSYRRRTKCKCIDVLLVESFPLSSGFTILETIEKTKNTLASKQLITVLGCHDNKLTALAKPDKKYRMVNFYFVHKDEYVPALFYLTGDNIFYEKFQYFCLIKGFRLDERSFCRIGYTCVNGSRIQLKDEYELFQYLDHPYIEPAERKNSLDLEKLEKDCR